MLFFVKLFIKLFFLHFKTLNASLLFSIQSWFKIQPQRNGEVGTFKWSINSNHPDPVACSPSFEKWTRKWRIFCAKKGDSLEQGVEYV